MYTYLATYGLVALDNSGDWCLHFEPSEGSRGLLSRDKVGIDSVLMNEG